MTIILRLFQAKDPGSQIDSRLLSDGELRIGRDAGQDWALDDPGRLMSRAHLVLSVQGERVSVTDTSSNGVFLAQSDQRVPQGRPTPVELGATLRFGPYLLQVERAPEGRVAEGAPSRPKGRAASPFAAAGHDEAILPAAPNPFGSVLAPDPFGGALDPASPQPARSPGDPVPASASSADSWSRPRPRRAGDWDAPSAARDGHEHLIGSGRSWSEPLPAPAPEVGFGFDAPFSQPLLRHVEVVMSDLAIPSDWDEAPEAPARSAAPPPATRRAVRKPVDAAPPVRSVEPSPEPASSRNDTAELLPSAADRVLPAVATPPPIVDPGPQATVAASPIPAPAAPAPRAPAPAPVEAEPARSEPPGAAALVVSDAALLEAFCRGAKLDPALFSRVEPEEMMTRLGVIYRSMILGMSDLMGERTSLKNEYRMVRTTMRTDDNNPFKWLPPQAVAAQLLLQPQEGFIGGAEAVTGAFTDMKKHLLCLLAGLRAALSSTLAALAPAQVEEGLKGQSLVMKNRSAAAWTEYGRRYADWKTEADDNPDSPVNRAFRSAYERQLTELDRMNPG